MRQKKYRDTINTTLLLLRGVLLNDKSNPTKILECLEEIYPKSLTVTDIYIKTRIAQSNVSSLLKDLEKLNLVRKKIEGRHVHCFLRKDVLESLKNGVATPLQKWVEKNG